MMAVGWPDLLDELDRWEKAEQVATLWWRDDDAVAPCPHLERLIAIAEEVPVALAVIPAHAEPDLASWLSQSRSSLAVLQHGWGHSNYSDDRKKSEFPASRPANETRCDLAAGRARLMQLFGSRALPVLVPPWNRFDDGFLPLLGACGINAISRVKPRRTCSPVPGVIEVDVHVDLVAWAGDRGFVGEEAALGGIVRHLRARRLETVCSDEPTGILTHHLIQDEVTHAFLRQIIAVTRVHPAARWLDAAEIFCETRLGRA
jgi:hypothetical protein